MMKRPFFVCAVVAVLVFCSAAQAFNVTQWSNTPTQKIGDTTFTFLSSNLPGSTSITLNLGTIGGQTMASLTVGNVVIDKIYELNYTLAIDQGMSPTDAFGTVSMSTSKIAGTPSVMKTIFEPNPDIAITSYNGTPSEVVSIPDSLKFMTIRDVWSSSGTLASTTNYFSETPEPATLAILGLGGLLLRRRMA
jgi:hypothetical protein